MSNIKSLLMQRSWIGVIVVLTATAIACGGGEAEPEAEMEMEMRSPRPRRSRWTSRACSLSRRRTDKRSPLIFRCRLSLGPRTSRLVPSRRRSNRFVRALDTTTSASMPNASRPGKSFRRPTVDSLW